MSHCPSDPFKRRPSNCLIVLYVCAITRDICCIFIVFFSCGSPCAPLLFFLLFSWPVCSCFGFFQSPWSFKCFSFTFLSLDLTCFCVFWTNSSLWGGGGLASNWTSLIRNCSQRIWKRRCCCYAAPYSCGGPHGICWFQPDKCDY